ncbi:MAG: class I SAM-dependent methyltransferase [Bacteroidota bacterium]
MALTAHLQDAYEKQYQDSQSEWRELGARQKVQNMVEVTGGKRFGKVLEVGAGDGSLLQLLNAQGVADELYALEISGSALERIHARNIPKLKEAKCFDGYSIPYEDNYFDLVVLSHVLEHVEFERKLLREIKRVSRYQVVEVPKDYRFGIDKRVKHFLSYGHINVYTPSSFCFLLRSEGFRILKKKVGLYSKATYQYMGCSSSGKYQPSFGKVLKANLLYMVKWLFVSAPSTRIRDHFANTITVMVEPEEVTVNIFK